MSGDHPPSATGRPDGRQRRWEQHKADRRRAVLDGALAVIERAGPGQEVHVQQIADEAGLRRTVLYRHFADRADLDRAIQTAILDSLWAEIAPVLSLDGTPVEVVRRIVAAYVGWASAHPALHRYVEVPVPSEGPSPLSRVVGRVARQIEALIGAGADLLGVPLDDDLRDGLDPLVFGMVGSARSAVRRWLDRPDRAPGPEALTDLLTESIWHQISGLAGGRGVEIDPETSLLEVLGEDWGVRT